MSEVKYISLVFFFFYLNLEEQCVKHVLKYSSSMDLLWYRKLLESVYFLVIISFVRIAMHIE